MADLLWSERPDAAATNLRSTLRRLASASPECALLVNAEGPTLSLDPGALRCDLALLGWDEDIANLKAATDAVLHKFLPDLGDGETRTDKWVQDVRRRLFLSLRSRFLKAQNEARAWEPELERAALALLDSDPTDDEIRRHLPARREIGRLAPVYGLSAPGGAAGWQWNEERQLDDGQGESTLPRLALLPPETNQDAKRHGSLINGLIEDLTIGLCANRHVSIVAPYTSERIRATRDKAAILEKHRIIYVLDTRRSDDQLFLQLIFTPTDEVIWADRLPLDDGSLVFQRKLIARAVEQAIRERTKGLPLHAADLHQRPQEYVEYLRGLQALSSLSLPAVRRARRHFRDALGSGHDFAAARAGLSRTLAMEWLLTARNDRELLTEAEQQARRAIECNGQLASGFRELGVSQLYLGRIDESLEALKQAELMSPFYADVLYSHADSLVHASEPSEALAKINTAIALNPLAPDAYYWTAAAASFFLGHFKQAVAFIARMRDNAPASRLAAASWAMLGEPAKARSWRKRALADNPDFNLERWLAMVPHREAWQTELYREGLVKAGF